MNNIDRMADDVLAQLKMHDVMKRKAYINVYVARQNLNPVIESLLKKASIHYSTRFENLAQLTWFLKETFGHSVDIWQKPDPYPKPSNHLLLTVGGLTAIIFDYEESI